MLAGYNKQQGPSHNRGFAVETEPAALSQPWGRPRELPEMPVESIRRRMLAGILFRTGCIRACEKLAHKWQWRSGSGNFRIRPNRVSGPRFAILCYHRIGTRGVPLHLGLPRRIFEKQIAYLRRHYRIASLEDLLKERVAPRTSEPSVAITFDDGYADLYSEAFPVLQQYAIPATIYLIAGSIQTGEVPWYDRIFVAFQVAPATRLMEALGLPASTRLESPKQRLIAAARYIFTLHSLADVERRARCDDLQKSFPLPRGPLANRMLNWDQIREMQSAGISFGSHTMSHPMLTRLLPPDLLGELRDSRKVLENELQRPVLDFAYPFGTRDSFDETTPSELAAFGYRSAVTLLPGVNTSATNPMALQRVVYCESASLPMFAARLSRLFLFPPDHNGVA